MLLWFSVSHGPWSHNLRLFPTPQPHSPEWGTACPSSQEEWRSWSLLSIRFSTNWLLASTTASVCMKNSGVLQGKVSSVNTGLRCSHPPLHLISSPTPQHRDVSALPAQLGEQQGIPQTTPVKGFTSGNPRLHRSSKRLQARMCYPSSFLTQALY